MKFRIRFIVVCLLTLSMSGCGQEPPAPLEPGAENFTENFHVTNQNVKVDSPEQSMVLPAGTSFVLLETKQDPILGKMARIGIDSDQVEVSDLWIENPDELIAASSLESEADLLEGENFTILKKQTYCYRYVKQYLLKTGQVNTYLPGSAAVQAYKILPKYGFRITGHGPNNALNGEVCVYSGGSKGYGHIEVKRNGSWWYGYGYISHPIRGRIFLACFSK